MICHTIQPRGVPAAITPEVGGRLEAAPVRPVLRRRDYLVLTTLILLGLIIHVYLVHHTAVPARDSLGYARVALNLSDPQQGRSGSERRSRMEVIRTAEHPPGYPIAIWCVEKILREVSDAPLPERVLWAAQYVNALAATVLVVPVYLLGRMLFGTWPAAVGTLLFQVLPVPAHVTSDGVSEGLYLLFVSIALSGGVWGIRRPRVERLLITGGAIGAAYLVRPEGILLAVPIGLMILGIWRGRALSCRLGWTTALAVGIAAIGLPYMLLIGKLTNKPTGKYLTNPFDDHVPPIWRGQPLSYRSRMQPDQSLSCRSWTHPGICLWGERTHSGICLWAEWWHPQKNAQSRRSVWAMQAVGKEMLKSLHYATAILALLGIACQYRRLQLGDPGILFLVAVGCLYLCLLFYLALRIGYVSERHTSLLNLLGCMFAASSLPALGSWLSVAPVVRHLVIWPRLMPTGLAGILVVTALPQTLQPLHPHREGHKHAGLWLAGQLQDQDWLVDPFCWAEWYAGRTLFRTTEYHGRPLRTWVVVEEGKVSPHSRLPQWEQAQELARHGQPVYQWPQQASSDQPRVVVYRVDDPHLVQRILSHGPR
mgnify:CR=1 FL=1